MKELEFDTPKEKEKFVEFKTTMLRRACSAETFRGYSSHWEETNRHTNDDGSFYDTPVHRGFVFTEKDRATLDRIKGNAIMSLRKDLTRVGQTEQADEIIQHPEEAL